MKLISFSLCGSSSLSVITLIVSFGPGLTISVESGVPSGVNPSPKTVPSYDVILADGLSVAVYVPTVSCT